MSPLPRFAARLTRAIASLLACGLLAAMVLAAVQGVRFMPVLTGSMTPYAPAGSLVLTVPVDGAEVAVGDVLAFRPPAPYEVAGGRPIFHRVATLDTRAGEPFMTTKGDANPTADPWQVATTGVTFGRGVAVVPHLGTLVAGGPKAVLALVLGVAALITGTRSLRRSAADRGGRHRGVRTVHRAAAAHAITVSVHVPAAQWSSPEGPARARTRAREALDQGLAEQGLVLTRPPEDHHEDDGAGGVRLRLLASAVPA